jgi:cytoskeletal protein RodZ
MPTVGDILAAERRRQGKSLTDAVEGTKIRSRLLDALEHGRYEQLEIPAEPLLDEYKKESAGAVRSSSPTDRYLADIPAETVVPTRERQHAIPRDVWIVVAVGVVVLILVLCGISRLFAGPDADTTPTQPGGAASSDVSASPGATDTTQPTTTITSVTGGFKLRIAVRDGLASWIKLQVDGLTDYEGTLQGGNSREVLVTGSAVLTLGKPSAVIVTRDGKPVTLPKADNSSITLSASE